MEENPIIELLDSAKVRVRALTEEIQKLEHERDVVNAQVEAYQVAADAIAEMQPKKSSNKTKARRNRAPNADWLKVFQHLANRFPSGFGYDEIVSVAEALGIEPKRPSLRSKMMNYANDGYVERVDDGRFAVTQKGRGYFKIEQSNERNFEDALIQQRAEFKAREIAEQLRRESEHTTDPLTRALNVRNRRPPPS